MTVGTEIYSEKNADSISEKNADSIKVTIACNYPFLRDGLGKILEEDKEIEIVAKISNVLDLIQSCNTLNSKILLLDVDLMGLSLAKMLNFIKKKKNTKVILIVGNNYDEYSLVSAIRYGVRGYLLQDADSKQLTKSIKSVSDGELWMGRKMMVKVLDSFSTPFKKGKGGTNNIYNLTETETKIIKLVFTGLSNKEIARDAYLSEKTVKFHLYKIFRKLSVKNRSQLILYGFQEGFIN